MVKEDTSFLIAMYEVSFPTTFFSPRNSETPQYLKQFQCILEMLFSVFSDGDSHKFSVVFTIQPNQFTKLSMLCVTCEQRKTYSGQNECKIRYENPFTLTQTKTKISILSFTYCGSFKIPEYFLCIK